MGSRQGENEGEVATSYSPYCPIPLLPSKRSDKHVRNSRPHPSRRRHERRQGNDGDAAEPQASRSRFDRLRDLRHVDQGRIRHAAEARRAGGSGEGPPHPRQDQGAQGRSRPAAEGAGRRRRSRRRSRPTTPSAIGCAYAGDTRTARDRDRADRGRRGAFLRQRAGADQGSRRRHAGLGPVRPRKFPRHARHRPHPHGDGIGRRYPLRAPLLGLPLQRHRRRP